MKPVSVRFLEEKKVHSDILCVKSLQTETNSLFLFVVVSQVIVSWRHGQI